MRIARTPKNIDIDLPIGCAPKPSQWPAIPKELTSAEHSTEIWSALSRSAEEEALAIRGIVGEAQRPHSGRQRKPEFITVPVLPVRSRNKPKASPGARAWRWIHRTMSDLAVVGRHLKRQEQYGNIKQGTHAQFQALRTKLKRSECQSHLGDHREVWSQVLRIFGTSRPITETFLQELGVWVELAAGHAAAATEHDVSESRKEWTKFLKNASTGQAAILHRISKVQTPWAPETPCAYVGDKLDPATVANSEMDTWAEEWQANDQAAQEDVLPMLRL